MWFEIGFSWECETEKLGEDEWVAFDILRTTSKNMDFKFIKWDEWEPPENWNLGQLNQKKQ